MNQNYDEQKKNKQSDQTSSINDDLQTEKQQQNSAKLRRDDEMTPE